MHQRFTLFPTQARYSMVYAHELRETGNQFMRSQLNYDPGNGNGREVPRKGGGDFLSIHVRRRDYIRARPGTYIGVLGGGGGGGGAER